MLTLINAHTEATLATVRRLFEAYENEIEGEVCFQGFQDELDGLPGRYAPPDGCLLLAESDGQAAGCVALHCLDATACEMKRLYVPPAFRGAGIGRKLAEAVIERARGLGYTYLRLDTLPSMQRARALYAALGFQEIVPQHPAPGVLYMELRLHGDDAS